MSEKKLTFEYCDELVQKFEEVIETPEETKDNLSIDLTTIILIVIPVGIGGALFMLKRMDKFDIILERIPIGDKIEEVKERISDLRNR